jgi:ABC-type transporter Mla maintaining outer membrane lipid asymmetry permease subunit MlaE
MLATAISGPLAERLMRVRLTLPKEMLISGVEWFGELGVFCLRTMRAAFVPPYELGELLRKCDEIGSKSLPLVALAGAATGVVLSLETRDSLVRFGAKSFLPAVIIFSIIKESGPIITGLIVSGRVGAGIGAQLGSMSQGDGCGGSGRQSGGSGLKLFPLFQLSPGRTPTHGPLRQ